MSEQTMEDKLAIQLMECAILVKKGERTNPIVLETLEKLRHFCHGTENGEGPPKERRFSNPKPAPTSTGPVHKPALGNVLGKMMGLTDEGRKTTDQKSATSQKNAARLKADLDQDHSGSSSWLPFGHSEEGE